MLASKLIRGYIGDSAPSADLVALYRTYYGVEVSEPADPANFLHLFILWEELRTLVECLDLDRVQIHREGAIARFDGARLANPAGRTAEALVERKRALSFYTAVLMAASKAKTRTDIVPAVAHQGAAMALWEAATAAQVYHDARKWEQPYSTVEQAKTAHCTAVAEAIACLRVAEGGADWIRVVHAESELPLGLVVGVGCLTPALVSRLIANLNPCRVLGLGHTPTRAIAMVDTAIQLVKAQGVLPRSTLIVTERMTVEALVTGMILTGRIPIAPWKSAGAGIFQRLVELCSASTDPGAPWQPGNFAPVTVADDPWWGPLVSMCLDWMDDALTLQDLEDGVFCAVYQQARNGSAYGHYATKLKHQLEAAQQLKPEVVGAVAVGVDWPMGVGVRSRLYQEAPIALLAFNERTPEGKYSTKYTITTHCGAPDALAFHKLVRVALNDLEPSLSGFSWTGGETIRSIIRSPRSGSLLTQDEIVAAVNRVATKLGMLNPLVRS